jgi:hypothetical protein
MGMATAGSPSLTWVGGQKLEFFAAWRREPCMPLGWAGVSEIRRGPCGTGSQGSEKGILDISADGTATRLFSGSVRAGNEKCYQIL